MPTILDVERIAAIPDPVLRNLNITQCYHELAMVLAARTGGQANWCTFATWASKQAGQTIRKEDLNRLFESILDPGNAFLQAGRELQGASPGFGLKLAGIDLRLDEFVRLAWKAYDLQSAFDRSSAAVARGNLKVFVEIGREFARFYEECLQDAVYNADHISTFCSKLRTGDPPEGQRWLVQAFKHYYQALFETDEKALAELLLVANLEIGYHEQTRLQPEINEALDAPVISPQQFTQNLLKLLRPQGGWVSEVTWFIMRLLGQLTDFDRAVQKYVAGARHQAQWIVTEALMCIELPPPNRLRLGNDLAASFPPLLLHIDNQDLLALLALIDPTPDNPLDSGAVYWGDLPDRIHFIADMFRCYELSSDLHNPPFSPEQTSAIKDGQIPGGQL